MKIQFKLFASILIVALFTNFAVGAPAKEPNIDQNEIALSYQYLTNDFYQKVSPQVILDSVRSDLLATLQHTGISHAMLPTLHASNLPNANIHAIDTEVNSAILESGSSSASAHLLSYAAIDGIMRSVNDRWTVFLDPQEYAALNQDLRSGDYAGIGIVIQHDDQTHYIIVSNVIPNGPADSAGLQQDDLIVSIDGISTENMQSPQAGKHLRGQEGTTVSLGIERNGKLLPTPILITRAMIQDESVFERMLPGKIGYVDLTVFAQNTGSELANALDRLEQEGMRAIVLDLRDNGGGYLDSAIAVSSKFISSGPIVSVEERASNITTWEADDTAISPIPLAVLVNSHTASASEITSGAIQDSGVGEIIGTQTFGKGVVQTIFPLSDGSAVKITTARYFTPHNRDINHLGITPDINVVENSAPRYGNPLHDAQLTRAIEYLNDQIANLRDQN